MSEKNGNDLTDEKFRILQQPIDRHLAANFSTSVPLNYGGATDSDPQDDDDDYIADESGGPERIEIPLSKMEFVLNNKGEENRRLLVRQSSDPNFVCEYGVPKKSNTIRCLHCSATGYMVYHAPANHLSDKCFMKKSKANKKQREIKRKSSLLNVDNSGMDENIQQRRLYFNTFISNICITIYFRISNEDSSDMGSDLKRKRRNEDVEIEKLKTFASTETQNDELFMCNLSSRPHKIENSENEIRCIINVHGFGTNGVKARKDGSMLIVYGEREEKQEFFVEKRSINIQLTLPENVQNYKMSGIADEKLDLLVVTFIKDKTSDTLDF
uniref:SHSP domain-containing protein n=1 Tax=Panagrolaimus davidi TaxID=227884 RepID=A0A914Q3B2_9BILA